MSYASEIVNKCKQIVDVANKYNITREVKKDKILTVSILEETKMFPNDISLSKRAIAIATNNKCICKNEQCLKVHGNPAKDFCSHECYMVFKIKNADTPEETKLKQQAYLITENNEKYKDAIEGFDYLECKICKFKTSELKQHVERLHKIQINEYQTQYNVEQIVAGIKSERVRGENNPAYQHGGIFSPFSKKFIHGDIVKETATKAVETRKINDNETTSLEYWLKKTNGNIEAAKQLLNDRQSTFNLEKCINEYGEDDGYKIWKERQDKWQKTLNSKSEEEKFRISKAKGRWYYETVFQPENLDPNKKCKFYIILYQPQNINETYVKIGATRRQLTDRWKSVEIKEIILIEERSEREIYTIEKHVKDWINENNLGIDPAKTFNGWTECIHVENRNKLLEFINELI